MWELDLSILYFYSVICCIITWFLWFAYSDGWFSSLIFLGKRGRGNWHRAGRKLVFFNFSSAHMWYVSWNSHIYLSPTNPKHTESIAIEKYFYLDTMEQWTSVFDFYLMFVQIYFLHWIRIKMVPWANKSSKNMQMARWLRFSLKEVKVCHSSHESFVIAVSKLVYI
jgi:hypothetical protein